MYEGIKGKKAQLTFVTYNQLDSLLKMKGKGFRFRVAVSQLKRQSCET